MKKIISILVSVMMILTAIPAFADTAAAAPASVDVYEGLDNFTDEQLKTDYTSENKFTTSTGLSAPLSANITAKVYNDEEVGDYLRVNADATGALGAALSFYDEDINVSGTGDQTVMTIKMKKRFIIHLLFQQGKICLRLISSTIFHYGTSLSILIIAMKST